MTTRHKMNEVHRYGPFLGSINLGLRMENDRIFVISLLYKKNFTIESFLQEDYSLY